MRTYAQAIAYAASQHVKSTPPDGTGTWQGKCQMYARSCVGAAPWGTPRTALGAWNAIPASHKILGKVVNGADVYFDDPNRSGEAGHAVFGLANGYVSSTDILRTGKVDVVHHTLISSKWGLRLLGSINWTPSGAINLAPTSAKPPVYTYKQGKKVYSSKMHLGVINSDSVWNVSLALQQRHYLNPPGDDYTPTLKDKVASFQRNQGWSGAQADGIVGPMTAAHLGLIWVNG
jgi:hypothetical protein